MKDAAPATNIYRDGSYLEKTGGTWHLQDSPLKARWVMRMLARHPEIPLRAVCELGCGAGGILSELQRLVPAHVSFTGYDISPQAIALSHTFANERCRYVLGDGSEDEAAYDLVLVMDVVEHVEDYFAFLRHARQKGRYKLYHIPLEAHVRSVLRGQNSWDSVGHLHVFTVETALKSIAHTQQNVIDWFITSGALEHDEKPIRSHVANLLRKPLHRMNPVLSARLLGGHSILILAE
jgi:SAM-dependent methyltransferase